MESFPVVIWNDVPITAKCEDVTCFMVDMITRTEEQLGNQLLVILESLKKE